MAFVFAYSNFLSDSRPHLSSVAVESARHVDVAGVGMPADDRALVERADVVVDSAARHELKVGEGRHQPGQVRSNLLVVEGVVDDVEVGVLRLLVPHDVHLAAQVVALV